jgi:peptidase MA superfamily protein
MRKILLVVLLLTSAIWAGVAAGGVSAAPGPSIAVEQNEISADFPNMLTFSGRCKSDSDIKDITLEYGTTQQTCGTVVAKSKPQFTPGKDVAVRWSWDMRQSGSLPPGATIWWQWVIEDESGVTRTPRQTATWLDDTHNWQTISGGNANLHWYKGSQSFGLQMHDAAVSAMQRMEQDTGLKADAPVDIYVYGSYPDLGDAVLYEPGWTGGEAFPDANIVIIGIAPDNTSWGRTAIAHELTHVMVGHLTFSCVTSVPTWVNEGLAVYSEGRLNTESQEQFDQAVAANTLLSVRSLSGGFSEVPGRAYLSYSESYSLVKYLLDTHGREKMNDLLLQLKDGVPIDNALMTVYGFNVDGLDDAWRSAIGAKPREQAANPTALPTPTVVPTIVPFAGVSSAGIQATQVGAGIPTSTPIPTADLSVPIATQATSSGTWDLIAEGSLGAACCLGLIIAGLLIFLAVRGRRQA